MAVEFYDVFASSYRQARERFRSVAEASGGRLSSWRHPTARGPEGEVLTVDVAEFGRDDARRQAMIVSGTHGPEGFCGSGVQIAWMTSGGPAGLAPGVKVTLIHALNPYGFAHVSRGNENNVDLNRNFLDHAAAPPNPIYDAFHPCLVLQDWTARELEKIGSTFAEFVASHGGDAVFDALSRGQYTCPDGINYGGVQREWSNQALEKIVDATCGGAEKVALIDWHTGMGEYGRPFFLCFNEPGSEAWERVADWWGREAVEGGQVDGFSKPGYTGLVFDGVRQFLGNRDVCGGVIEFGTRGERMRSILSQDLWLRFRADPTTEAYRMLKADLLDAFFPVDRNWREDVLRAGTEIMRRTLNGVTTW